MTRRSMLAGLLLAPAIVRAQEARAIFITLQDGTASGRELAQPTRGAPALRLRQGEAVALHFMSDRDIRLHLHGYDIEARATPGAPAVMAFIARAAGRFALETHGENGRHAALLYIEVHPK